MSNQPHAKFGVDYTKIEWFKEAMIRAGQKISKFPDVRSVYAEDGEQSVIFEPDNLILLLP